MKDEYDPSLMVEVAEVGTIPGDKGAFVKVSIDSYNGAVPKLRFIRVRPDKRKSAAEGAVRIRSAHALTSSESFALIDLLVKKRKAIETAFNKWAAANPAAEEGSDE